jgi:hypothetical protein
MAGPRGCVAAVFRREFVMLKIRLSSALAAMVAAALMTFVTVVPPPASAETGAAPGTAVATLQHPVLV